MFPHVPLQAITLDLADTRSISLTVEHILNNTIYIPDSATTTDTLTSATTHTPPVTPSQSPEAQTQPLTSVGEEGGGHQMESGLRRRHRRDRDNATGTDNDEKFTDNQSGATPCDEIGDTVAEACDQVRGDEEDDPMTFSSLQRRKRELLINAKQWVVCVCVCIHVCYTFVSLQGLPQ